MNLEDQVRTYVQSQISGKDNLAAVTREELESHLLDAIQNLRSTGLDESSAFAQAVRELGSTAPVKKWILRQRVRQITQSGSVFYAVLALLFSLGVVFFPFQYDYDLRFRNHWIVPPLYEGGSAPGYLYTVPGTWNPVFFLLCNPGLCFLFCAMMNRRLRKYLAMLMAAYSICFTWYFLKAVIFRSFIPGDAWMAGPGIYALVLAFICPLLAVVREYEDQLKRAGGHVITLLRAKSF